MHVTNLFFCSFKGRTHDRMSRNIYMPIMRINFYAMAEIESRTIDVYLLVRVKNVSIFRVVNLRMSRVSSSPIILISETMVNRKTITLI